MPIFKQIGFIPLRKCTGWKVDYGNLTYLLNSHDTNFTEDILVLTISI